ncbi:hypothetical protein EP7_000714 [Isosphaeraceae bacterium EP7]
MNKSIATLVASCSLVAATLISLPGCGDDGFGKRYPVSGKITYKGEAVSKGNINFLPLDNTTGRAAQSEITDGSYSLTTASPNDGALPGKYKVTIISVEADYSKVMANAKGGAGRQEDVYKANKSAKKLVPSKYSIFQTTPLEETVKEESNTINFDLTD